MNTELSIIEKNVLKKLLMGSFPILTQLRNQLNFCTIKNRKFTGFGFYTTFIVPEKIHRNKKLNFMIGDVNGEIEGLNNGAGFLLYIKNGVIDMLEGYSYDESWPASIDKFKLFYTKGIERDWNSLEETLNMKR
jgi:hypothetical protein